MKRPPSEGTCELCQSKFTKNTITRHLQKCLPEHDPPRGKETKLFHLVVEGYGPYWLQVEMPAEATLGDLDQFLRDTWLECCGHLSTFHFDRTVKQRCGLKEAADFDWDFAAAQRADEELMDTEIAELLEPKLAFGYDYDFGSTTTLRLKVAGSRTGKWSGKPGVRLLARNLPPQVSCTSCGKAAKWIDVYDEGFFCAACARKVEDEEGLLPVVNSPRMGVCGYTGGS